jgi:hypothetical protein
MRSSLLVAVGRALAATRDAKALATVVLCIGLSCIAIGTYLGIPRDAVSVPTEALIATIP